MVEAKASPLEMLCFRCNKKGHKKNQCPGLRSRFESSGRPVALVSSGSGITSDLEGYEGFTSEGTVAVSQEGLQVPVTILRDTGAVQTLLSKGVVDLPPASFTGRYVLVHGLGGGYVHAPIYRIYLKSELVSACVEVAEVNSLPVRGIDLLLGNDIAGTRVNPEVVDCPVYPVEMKEMEAEFPEVFTLCVVTRAQAREKLAVGAPAPGALSSPLVDEEPMVDLCDTVFPQWLTFGVLKGVREPINDIAAEIGTSQSLRSAEVTEVVLPSEVGGDDVAESDAKGVVIRSEMSRAPEVSQPTFVQEQKEDPSLEHAVKVATSARESDDVATGYFVR